MSDALLAALSAGSLVDPLAVLWAALLVAMMADLLDT